MALRIAFDMDGVLADFGAGFRAVEARLFGPEETPAPPAEPEVRAEEEQRDEAILEPALPRRRTERVWREIEATPDFWTTLSPLEPAAVPRIHEMAAEYRWEVLFVTQRPETAGETVQRQTQRWLAAHGFELPSVVVIPGSRGRAAAALRLDYLVDDNSKNCVDAISDSHGTKPFLVLREPDAVSERSARKLGIRVVRSVGECLDVLARVSVEGQDDPGILDRIAQRIGWRKPVAP